MKQILALVVVGLLPFGASAGKYVSGYTKKDGTYVQGHYKSDADQNRYNNLSSQSMGGSKRDEFSNGGGATNKSNSAYGLYDNDRDGIYNSSDRKPDLYRAAGGWHSVPVIPTFRKCRQC